MYRTRWCCLLLVGMTACIEPIAPADTTGWADLPFEASEAPSVEVDTRPRSNLPPEITALRAGVRGLGDAGTPDRAVYGRALRDLAAALVVVGPGSGDRTRAIEQAAAELAGAVLTGESDAGVVRNALEDARVVLATGQPRPGADVAAYEQAVTRLRAVSERIDPTRSLMSQHDAVIAAFVAALAALEIAADVRT